MQKIRHAHSRALLEERDYIGLSETSSATEMKSLKDAGSFLKDTDLRLGLGLGLALGSGCEEGSDVLTQPAKALLRERSGSGQRTGMKRGTAEMASKPTWLHASMAASDVGSQESACDDAPPSKDQIVGWPPVRLYRKQTMSKPVEIFVKVNMDGMTVGRKVDLGAYTSYKGLLVALEEMFRPSQSGRESDMKHFLVSAEPDYVLTYEDKDGDWMLVGDVPWSMFTLTVKRLRITRGLDANGTGMPTRFC